VWKPEFVNRLDEMIVFPRLSRPEVRSIVDKQLARFQARLEKKQLSVELTDRAKDFLCDEGWDPAYGARPLKRAIQKHLEDAFAKEVLAGKFAPQTAVHVDYQDGKLLFGSELRN
jgi:ATP-dependent Clp protease ATP-binding subunit ClpA